MARFTLPRDLYHGKGALEALKSLTGKKAIICVGGGSMKKFGFLDRAVSYLKEAGMEVQIFEGIEPDPSVETVMRGAEAMLAFEPDWIIAMGGGSPIDAAKAMWIKYEYPEITFEDMCQVFVIPPLRKKAHFCAISSTSGTATEVTAFSIITDYSKGIKYPIADFEITPDVAIVDPDLAETMPKKLVAHTGMDAMTHAIEAYVSTAHCDYTDPLAIFAIKMIQNVLIGVTAFGIAVYWCTSVEKTAGRETSLMEIWHRFPKFVIGFLTASIIFSIYSADLGPDLGTALINKGVIDGIEKGVRTWFFVLAFTAIGLSTNFRELAPYFKGGKPLILYVCGQSFNLALTLLMAYVMFYLVFPEITAKS